MGSLSRDYHILIDAPAVKDKKVVLLPQNGLTDFMQSVISDNEETKEPFYILDLSVVSSLMNNMINSLPMIQPFYAVKCNPDPVLLGALAALGSNFDCSSLAEIEAVLSLGVSADRIIYANPCKAESHIKYAASVGVELTTFDSKHELVKIKKWHPKCSLLLRIKSPVDGDALTSLDSKYGALEGEIIPLLEAAKSAGLKVIGVSFHIGSGASNIRAYEGAIAMSKNVFETASQLGLPRMHVLNIGGGFRAGPLFDEATKIIKEAINTYFSNEHGLRVISEPGRFFAETTMTLATNIIGKRVRDELREYWINDGVYGCLNCVINENTNLICTPLACQSNPLNPNCESSKKYTSTVFGPTCDACDTVIKGQELPELEVNDWLVFPNRGAYGLTIGSKFNGFDTYAIGTYFVFSG